MNNRRTCLRASWVLPITGPPLTDAFVVVEGDRIVGIGSGSPPEDAVAVNFGAAVLMPGLVNVHTHLDYTLMRGLLEDLEFFPWIRQLTARAFSLSAEDWLASATWGAAEAVSGGVTCIGDCTFSGGALSGAKALGLRGIVYQEVFGIDEAQPVPDIIADLGRKASVLRQSAVGSALTIGISPHSPYTVRPALLRALARYADNHSLSVCIHAAESQAEAELIRSGAGPIAQMYADRRIAWTAPGTDAVHHLDSCGILSERTLLVHGVQVSAGDRVVLRDRDVAWAHCPKSNAKLGNGVAPLGILGWTRDSPLESETMYPTSGRTPRIGLGSDSVASNNTMDLFEEMRFAVLMQRARHHRIQALSARDAMEMATIGGARALGLDAEIGSLEVGKQADICVVSLDGFHALPAYDPYQALVYSARASDVLYTMIRGQVRYDHGRGPRMDDRFPGIEPGPVRQAVLNAARRMRDWTAPS